MERICLVPPNAKAYDAAWNLAVDVVLNEDGTASSRMVAVGARGGLGEAAEEVEPFLLGPHGAVDFGSDYDGEDRDARFDLRDAALPAANSSPSSMAREGRPPTARRR